jgi:isocitrate dehydrogenase kinase/phosphatase
MPLSKGYHDWYGVSLDMTPVDALDTMILMGLTNEASEVRELIATNLSFNQDIYVKNFEITIHCRPIAIDSAGYLSGLS